MAFVTEAALIALREGLEALLITGILIGLVTRLGRPDARKHVWLGFGAAVITSIIAGVAIHRYLLTSFEENGWGAAFELGAVVLAVATLTYMVFWMWSHTTQVLRRAKDQVRAALTTGSLFTIVFITYISVVREGLETVLFYSALSSQEAAIDLVWSGAIGFAISAVLVYAVLRTSRKVGLKRFFTATGLVLIVVAAMLLTHVPPALTELGVIGSQRAIWDTSGVIADGSAAGRLLHATVGYTATPTLLQAGLYFGYLFLAGGAYLWMQGFFHRSTTDGRAPARGKIAAGALALVLVASAVGVGATNPTDTLVGGHGHGLASHSEDESDHDHEDSIALPEDVRVGVVLRNHGEPVHYNETTYESFAEFTRHLLVMLGMEALLEIDQGTVLIDQDRPFADEPSLDPNLMDAWTHPHPGPAVWTSSPAPDVQQIPLLEDTYVAPGGPGLGEPDVLEAAGLGAYRAWVQMEGYSPMQSAKSHVLDLTERGLAERYGDDLVVIRGYSIEPHVGPKESFEATAQQVVDADVDVLVDAYTSHLHSDVMDTCMMQPRFAQALEDAGFDGRIVRSGPSGLNTSFADGVAAHVADRLASYAPDDRVSVFLTHHGLEPDYQSPCRDRADPYNAQATEMFEQTKTAIEALDLDREIQILQVYGQGSSSEDDGVLSPTEALDAAREFNATHVLDLPYELPGNGFDNLVNHRHSYGLQPEHAPFYNADYETHLTREGMAVLIASSAFAHEARAHAQVHVIEQALERAFPEAG